MLQFGLVVLHDQHFLKSELFFTHLAPCWKNIVPRLPHSLRLIRGGRLGTRYTPSDALDVCIGST